MFAEEDDKYRREREERKRGEGKSGASGGGGGGGGGGRKNSAAAAARKQAALLATGDDKALEAEARGHGVVRLSDVLPRFTHTGGQPVGRDAFIAAVEAVAGYDPATDLLRRRTEAPTPEAFREAASLTPERCISYESLLVGEERLRRAGLSVLRVDDKQLDDALRRLQSLYDRMVDRLKAVTSGAAGGAGDSSTLWEHDGGYRRLRRTLEIGHAIYYLLQTAPWTSTHNYLAYMRRGDVSMLALQDAAGIGDPSGRGDAFSFVRDLNQSTKRLHSSILQGAAAPGTGGAFLKKEGTDRDARALTMTQMAQMLADFRVHPETIRRMKRWERVRAIRDKQNAQQTLARGGAVPAMASSSLLFTGAVRLTLQEQRNIKGEQEQEIQRRQQDALCDPVPPEVAEEDEESDTDEEFAAELEAAMDDQVRRERSKRARGASRAKELAEQDERAEFEAFRKQRLAAAAAAAAPSAGAGGGAAGAGAGAAGSGLAERFPLPLSLLRPPHAPLLASTWEGSDAADGHTGSPHSSSALSSSSRPGAMNPVHLGSLAEPPRPPVFARVPAGDAAPSSSSASAAASAADASGGGAGTSGGWSASGKILRVIRSTVGADGRQVVRVTYSTSEHMASQVWLKQRVGVDLGVLAVTKAGLTPTAQAALPPPAIDPTGSGLVETGFFAPPKGSSGYTGRFRAVAERERERDNVVKRYGDLRKLGFVLDGSRSGQSSERKIKKLVIHGTGVPVCDACRLWGHRLPGGRQGVSVYMCPASAPGGLRARAGGGGVAASGGDGVTDEALQAIREAVASGGESRLRGGAALSTEDLRLRESVDALSRRMGSAGRLGSAGGKAGPLAGGAPGAAAQPAASISVATAAALLPVRLVSVRGGGWVGGRRAGRVRVLGCGCCGAPMPAAPLPPPPPPPPQRIREEPSVRTFCKLLEGFLTDLMYRDDLFAMFRAPVDVRAVPAYRERVKEPMDLGTIRSAVVARRYRYLEDFHHDLLLILAASDAFNGPTHGFTKRARAMLKRADEFYITNARELRELQLAMPREEEEVVAYARSLMPQPQAIAEAGDAAQGAAQGGPQPEAAEAGKEEEEEEFILEEGGEVL